MSDVVHVVVLIVVVAAWLAFWIVAVRSILNRRNVSGTERGIWIAVVIIFPFLGPLVWFLYGRNRQRAAPSES